MRAYLAGEPTPHLLRIERILLERGWQVDVATSGDAGFGRYEIIVVESTGSDQMTTPQIADLRRQIDHELVLLLGDFPLTERSRGLSVGADDVIQCDAPGALIVSRLMALLRLRLQHFKDSYRIGELVVDMTRRRVRRGGRDILLSQREFQLLVLLARDAGTVLPRSTIIDGLWAGDLSIADNAVDALASRLRRRIDGPFGAKMLRTVRGIGYGLVLADELRLAS
jgi:two-component system copper resistance phosphate regulon response regulator CusR